MLGRDKLRERGATLPALGNWSDKDDITLGEATRCVKKFAPNGKQRMGRRENGHITACKISDANPNELIVSWSGDWIYSFDIMRSPDATEEVASPKVSMGDHSHRVKERTRKRKRTKSSMLLHESGERLGSRPRTESSHASASKSHEGLALRVNYGNGQSEEIRIAAPESPLSESEAAALRDTDHYRIARTTVKIQKQMFTLNPNKPATAADGPDTHTPSLTSVLGFAASIIPEMDEIARTWGYPIDPNEVDVALQNKLRDDRAASRRFVQAAGTLARILGGQLRTGSGSDAIISRYFAVIQPAPNERPLPRHEHFAYDFLKAILLWLDSGLGALVEGFSSAGANARLPLPPDADIDAIDDILIPHLLRLASDTPVVDVDVSKFETDDRRLLFKTEKDAVIAFATALKLPFADLTGAVVPVSSASSSASHTVQDRKTAISRWGFKVGRGVLLNAGRDIRFALVDRAFGGRGVAEGSIKAEEEALREKQEDVDPLEDDDVVIDAELVRRGWAGLSAEQSPAPTASQETVHETESEEMDGSAANDEETAEGTEEDTDEEEEDSDGDIEPMEEDNDDEDDDVDEEGLSHTRSGHILWRSDFDRSYLRERVESDVPCAPHTKVFRGHCNLRTVKDVNYFGLQDEYVVSGSDSGHVFIWDRKTSELLNILEGDGEVVNVVQGHPYEPIMAVSGIDHTIKIFSPDAHAQRNARLGIGVHSADRGFSSLGFGLRRRTRPENTSEPALSRETSQALQDISDEGDERVAPHGLASRKRMDQQYTIMAQNDEDRKGGREDAFITVSYPFLGFATIASTLLLGSTLQGWSLSQQ
jgi:nuclear receptor interaction protein